MHHFVSIINYSATHQVDNYSTRVNRTTSEGACHPKDVIPDVDAIKDNQGGYGSRHGLQIEGIRFLNLESAEQYLTGQSAITNGPSDRNAATAEGVGNELSSIILLWPTCQHELEIYLSNRPSAPLTLPLSPFPSFSSLSRMESKKEKVRTIVRKWRG